MEIVFSLISLIFTNNQNYYQFFRELLYLYIYNKIDAIYENSPYILNKDKLTHLYDYIPLIK